MSKVPFLSIHATYKNYENDLLSTCDEKYAPMEIPDELVGNILTTQGELKLGQ